MAIGPHETLTETQKHFNWTDLQPVEFQNLGAAYNLRYESVTIPKFDACAVDLYDIPRKGLFPGSQELGAYHYDDPLTGKTSTLMVISFLYHKVDEQTGKFESQERVFVRTGVGDGVLQPDHIGQKATIYAVGPQIGTREPTTGELILVQDGTPLDTKNFSTDCIVGRGDFETVIANPAVERRTRFIKLGKHYIKSFERFRPATLSAEQREKYDAWTKENHRYEPVFTRWMREAIDKISDNPSDFESMLADFDGAVDLLNSDKTDFDRELYPNIAIWLENKADAVLPRLSDPVQLPFSSKAVIRGIQSATIALRRGESFDKGGKDTYSYQVGVATGAGMIATSLIDLYEIMSHEIGIKIPESNKSSLLANALTEAVHLNSPTGALMNALSDIRNEWIYGYPEFSDQFQFQTHPDFARPIRQK